MTTQKSYNVLVVGGGGREHALVQACGASPLCGKVIAAPGNPGIARQAGCFPVAVDDVPGMVRLARDEGVDLVVVGPEVPLSLGLADALREEGFLVYGPGREAARLEASKIFTKNLLKKHGIPTAASETFTEAGPARDYVAQRDAYPVVIKADGLAAGKGVIIARDYKEADGAITDCLDRDAFGEGGRSILIEDHLEGEEASLHLMVSSKAFVVLPTSQDHKRAGENDTGPNTGGMGAYSPAELLEGDALDNVIETIARPSVEAIAAEGLDFRGTLYIGLMMTASGPEVLEFNVRFGDPETQVILPRMVTDPLALMLDCAAGTLTPKAIELRKESAVCVVLAAGGYPGAYRKGDVIELPEVREPDAYVFHAGTAAGDRGEVVTAGGRVLGIACLGDGLAQAARAAYALCEKVRFEGMYYRRDIAAKQLNRKNRTFALREFEKRL